MANARPQAPGNLSRIGTGAPAAGLGGEGELYYDRASGRQYERIGGAWGLVFQPTLPTSKLTGTVDLASQVSGSLPAASVSGLPAWTYGTAFPGSPADGDKHTLVDSTTNPSYHWTFRYNASSISYKWEFVGGNTWQIQSGGFTSNFASTWTEITACRFTIPRAGEYEVKFTIAASSGTATATMLIGIFVAGGIQAQLGSQQTDGGNTSESWVPTVIAYSASDIISPGYWVNGTTGWTVYASCFQVVPKRCS